MPFMDEPPGAQGVDDGAAACTAARSAGLRRITAKTVDEEPKWRTPGKQLLTGYQGEWR